MAGAVGVPAEGGEGEEEAEKGAVGVSTAGGEGVAVKHAAAEAVESRDCVGRGEAVEEKDSCRDWVANTAVVVGAPVGVLSAAGELVAC